MPPFYFVGSGSFAQANVAGSPAYGTITVSDVKRGLSVFKPAANAAGLVHLGLQDVGEHCSYLAMHPQNGLLYALARGKLLSVKISASGELSVTSSADTLGSSVFLELSRDGCWALVANYREGSVVVLPIKEDGRVGDATDSKLHKCTPKEALVDRQEGPHAHQVRLDPSQRWALVCDLGADRVFVYAFNSEAGGLIGAENSKRHLVLPEGAGPRHLDFHPDGKFVFILCELGGFVVVCDWDAEAGRLTAIQEVSAMPDGVACSRANHSGMAHILVSADGHTLYVSSRTDNQIVAFKVDMESRFLVMMQSVSTCGVCPRNFHLDYSSQPARLRVLNQDSQNIVTFSIRPETGALMEPPDVLQLDGICPVVILGPTASA